MVHLVMVTSPVCISIHIQSIDHSALLSISSVISSVHPSGLIFVLIMGLIR